VPQVVVAAVAGQVPGFPGRSLAGREEDDVADQITLRGLRVHGRHGVLPEERAVGQPFVVDVSLDVDTRPAARSDDLAQTIDYSRLATDLAEAVSKDPVDLIETVAQRVADLCLDQPRVAAVEVTIHKPEAPVDVQLDDIAVTIHRSRT
jgi:7,8-dihydroneopterin aldolase/epimerase/oxygenase